MLSRFVAIALSLLGLSLGACTTKDDRTNLDPGGPVEMPPVPRDVVDAGLVILNLDADVYGPGGSTGLIIPDAGPRPDLAPDAAATPDLAGVGSTCRPLIQTDCTNGNPALACYPGANGTGRCTAPTGSGGELANCNQSSDCAPGYFCGTGRTASNLCLLLCDVQNPGCVKSRPCVEVPGFKDNTGYCLE